MFASHWTEPIASVSDFLYSGLAMSLRDLREDLRQRLMMVEIERAAIESRLAYLTESEAHIKSLLAFEEMRVKSEAHNLSLPLLVSPQVDSENRGSTLTAFIRDKLSDGRSWSLGNLKKEAHESNIDFAGKQPGRVLHFTLLGMAQNGIVEMVAKGVWRMLGNVEKN